MSKPIDPNTVLEMIEAIRSAVKEVIAQGGNLVTESVIRPDRDLARRSGKVGQLHAAFGHDGTPLIFAKGKVLVGPIVRFEDGFYHVRIPVGDIEPMAVVIGPETNPEAYGG